MKIISNFFFSNMGQTTSNQFQTLLHQFCVWIFSRCTVQTVLRQTLRKSESPPSTGTIITREIQLWKGSETHVCKALDTNPVTNWCLGSTHPVSANQVALLLVWKRCIAGLCKVSTVSAVIGCTEYKSIGRWSVLPFWPKYRLGHPENYLFSLSKKLFLGSKYPKIK